MFLPNRTNDAISRFLCTRSIVVPSRRTRCPYFCSSWTITSFWANSSSDTFRWSLRQKIHNIKENILGCPRNFCYFHSESAPEISIYKSNNDLGSNHKYKSRTKLSCKITSDTAAVNKKSPTLKGHSFLDIKTMISPIYDLMVDKFKSAANFTCLKSAPF